MNGVIVLWKEAGMTSFDAVRAVRRITGQKKAGHGGTLDPEAAGVLPVFLGNATKLADFLSDGRKTYDAEMTFGFVSDTEDIWGKLEEIPVERIPSEREILEVLRSFEGEYIQVPPMYSAKKVNGVKLYKLARKQIEIERKPEKKTVYGISLTEIRWPAVRFSVECSKGTYVRTLCTDIGKKLGISAVMSALTRTRHGRFGTEETVTLRELEKLSGEGRLSEVLIPPEQVLSDYPSARVRESSEKALLNGNKLSSEELVFLSGRDEDGPLRVFSPEGSFLALYGAADSQGLRKPLKMFLPGHES